MEEVHLMIWIEWTARRYAGVLVSLLARFVHIFYLKGFNWCMDKVKIVNYENTYDSMFDLQNKLYIRQH